MVDRPLILSRSDSNTMSAHSPPPKSWVIANRGGKDTGKRSMDQESNGSWFVANPSPCHCSSPPCRTMSDCSRRLKQMDSPGRDQQEQLPDCAIRCRARKRLPRGSRFKLSNLLRTGTEKDLVLCTFLYLDATCQIGLKSFVIWRGRRGSNPRPLP